MPDWGSMLVELEQHEPSFAVAAEARRRAAGAHSRPPRRWKGRVRLGAAVALAAVGVVGVVLVLALAAHSRRSNAPAPASRPGFNTPRQELVADAQLLSSALASQLASALRYTPHNPRQVIVDPAWSAHARAVRSELGRSDPLYPLFTTIVTAQRLAGAGQLSKADRLILPAANQARSYAAGHPAQSPRQPPAWAVRFFALNERPHIAEMERAARAIQPSGYSDLSWPAYGFSDQQDRNEIGTPPYTGELSWLRPGTRWHIINQLHLRTQALLEGGQYRQALPVLRHLKAEIDEAIAASARTPAR
jgi:hypothetical protein